MTARARSQSAARDLNSLRDAIRVVPIQLESDPYAFAHAWTMLAPDEAARARAFKSARAQAAFVQCRAMLRRMLAAYLRRPHESLAFEFSDEGKPWLAAHPELGFNVSHSGSLALMAFTLGAEVGVDIERMRATPNALALAARFFSAQESQALHALPAADIDQAFLSCWTRKEAAVKALGIGVEGHLAAFSVPLGAIATPVPIEVCGTGLTLHSLSLAPHAVGALAHTGPLRPLQVEPFRRAAELFGTEASAPGAVSNIS